MRWLGRFFNARDSLARMVLLDLSGIGYLVFNPGSHSGSTGTQLLLAGFAFALALACHRAPLVNLVGQSALLAVAILIEVPDTTINQVGASWALLEVALWAGRPRLIWLGAGLLTAVGLLRSLDEPLHRFPLGLYSLTVEVGVPLLIGLVIRTTRELGRQAEARAEEHQRRQEADNRAARADERSAIARELHDVVAHHVASMVLRVGVARHVLPELDPRVGEVFDDVHATGSAALADLRRLVAVLRTADGVRDAALAPIEPSALPAALGVAVDRARQAGITVEAEIDPAVGRLDAVRGLAVLRLTQEALTNVAKHAGTAARARLCVSVVDDEVHWEVSDDGAGSVPAGMPPGGGHGITGMRERVEVLGGSLAAGPTGTGWRVGTVLPAAGPGSAAPLPQPRVPEPS